MPAVAIRAAHLVADLHVAERAEPYLLRVSAWLLMSVRTVRRDCVRMDVAPSLIAWPAAALALDRGQMPAVQVSAREAIGIMREHGAIVARLGASVVSIVTTRLSLPLIGVHVIERDARDHRLHGIA
jgi:hypothetical protein